MGDTALRGPTSNWEQLREQVIGTSTTLLERLVPLVERLQGQGADGRSGACPASRRLPRRSRRSWARRSTCIKTILAPGADGKPLPLGQVNGALGQTIGNLLNGKKTALGLLGAVATPMLTQASTTTALAPVLAMLTPAAGLSALRPADLPRADRLGRARQDGEMVPGHRPAAESMSHPHSSSFRGAADRREPGIHNHRRCLWIPGSLADARAPE